MKATNFEVIQLINGIQQAYKISKEQQITVPFKVRYAFNKSMPSLQETYKAYDDTLKKLQKEHDCRLGENETEEFKKDLNELLGMEVDINPHQLSIDEFVLDIPCHSVYDQVFCKFFIKEEDIT